MPWTELADLRNRSSRQYQDDANPLKRAWSGTLAALHYESDLDSGIYDAEVDATPQRIDNPMFDGWRVTANGWHYALGKDLESHGEQDGWLGFGGRQGAHWFKFRLLRVGYLHWPTRAWDDIGGAPTYDRADLNRETRTLTLGPNADQIKAESVATWSSVWTTPGGGALDISWKARGNDLKEEIIINQAGREWIAANRPPATPLDETWFGFVFRLDWSDIPRIYRAGLLQDIDGDFADDGEGIELRDALDHLLAFMPIGHVVASVKGFAQGGIERQSLRKRFWKDGDGNHYLLVGVRCDVLNGMKAGLLIFDPTIQHHIAATARDGGSEAGTDEMIDPATSVYGVFYIGYDDNPVEGAWIWETTIGDGATIDSATVTLRDNTETAQTVECDWYGFDIDSPDDFNAAHTHRISDHHTRTTATVVADFDATAQDPYVSGELKTIVQEIVDRAGVGANPKIGLTLRSDESNANDYYSWLDYDDNSAQTAQLDIEYTAAGGITVEMDTLGLAAAAQTMTQVSGAISLTMDTLDLASTAQSLTQISGAVSLAMDMLGLTGSVQALNVSVGAISLTMDILGLLGGAQSLAVSPGAVSMTMDVLGLTGTAQSLTVSPGTISLAMDVLGLVGAAQSLDVVPGSVSLAMDTLGLSVTAQTLTVSTALIIAMDALGLTGAAQSLAVTPGAIDLLMDTLGLTGDTQALSVSPGAISLAMDTLSLSGTAETLTQVSGAVNLAMSILNLSATAQSLTVSTGVRIALALLALTGSTQGLAVVPGEVTVALNELQITAAALAVTIVLAGKIDATLTDTAVTLLTLSDVIVTALAVDDAMIASLTLDDVTRD